MSALPILDLNKMARQTGGFIFANGCLLIVREKPVSHLHAKAKLLGLSRRTFEGSATLPRYRVTDAMWERVREGLGLNGMPCGKSVVDAAVTLCHRGGRAA